MIEAGQHQAIRNGEPIEAFSQHNHAQRPSRTDCDRRLDIEVHLDDALTGLVCDSAWALDAKGSAQLDAN
jgi:hypothetical protein